jgi:hypothetical protein
VIAPDHSRVYIGGDFKKVGASPRTRLAAVDTGNGVPTLWTPTPAVPGQVVKMAVSPDGSKVYAALGGASGVGNRLQAFSTTSNLRLWEAVGDGDFQAVALSSSLLYAGGHFDLINGVNVRQHLATFDPDTGALQPWGPSIGGIKGVLDLQVTAGHIYVAGEFDKIGNTVAQGIARFTNAGDPPPTTTTTAPGSTPTTMPSEPTTTLPPGGGSPGGGNPGPGVGAADVRSGYWMVGSEGAVYSFGDAGHHGGTLPAPGTSIVDLEPTPSGKGYWLVTDKGVVTVHGDAAFFGAPAPGSIPRGETVTSLSSTPAGRGYWLFTSKGRVLHFGDAAHYGDMANIRLNAPVLDSIPTTSGRGYYMVAADGGIFSFGDARFYGSMGGRPLNAAVQSLVPDGDGVGYWLVASDGGIFAFQADFKGSMGGQKLNKPVTGMVRFADGYLMVGEDGGIFNFSSKKFLGSLGGNPPARPIVSVAVLG